MLSDYTAPGLGCRVAAVSLNRVPNGDAVTVRWSLIDFCHRACHIFVPFPWVMKDACKDSSAPRAVDKWLCNTGTHCVLSSMAASLGVNNADDSLPKPQYVSNVCSTFDSERITDKRLKRLVRAVETPASTNSGRCTVGAGSRLRTRFLMYIISLYKSRSNLLMVETSWASPIPGPSRTSPVVSISAGRDGKDEETMVFLV